MQQTQLGIRILFRGDGLKRLVLSRSCNKLGCSRIWQQKKRKHRRQDGLHLVVLRSNKVLWLLDTHIVSRYRFTILSFFIPRYLTSNERDNPLRIGTAEKVKTIAKSVTEAHVFPFNEVICRVECAE